MFLGKNMYENHKNDLTKENIVGIRLSFFQSLAFTPLTSKLLLYYWKSNDHSIQTIKIMLRHLVSRLAIRFADAKFSTENIDEMVNEALAYYLTMWLKNAPNTKQTCTSFAKQPFTLMEDQEKYKPGENTLNCDDKFERKIARAVKEYRRNVNKRTGKTLTPKSKKKQRECYNFIELCFADWYISKEDSRSSAKSDLTLYRDLMNSKDENKLTGRKILLGYDNYLNLLCEIGKETNSIALVTKILTFIDIESTYRFLLSYQIITATYQHTGLKVDDFINEIDVFYQGIPCKEKDYALTLSSIRNCGQLINPACSNSITDELKYKIFAERIISMVAFDTLTGSLPNCLTLNWTKQTFEDAANFLVNEYHFDEIELSVDPDFLLSGKDQHSKSLALRRMILKMLDSKRLSQYKSVARVERKAENNRCKGSKNHP